LNKLIEDHTEQLVGPVPDEIPEGADLEQIREQSQERVLIMSMKSELMDTIEQDYF
jgi:hypothetical protein